MFTNHKKCGIIKRRKQQKINIEHKYYLQARYTRWSHNPNVVGSNPASATTLLKVKSMGFLPLSNTIVNL